MKLDARKKETLTSRRTLRNFMQAFESLLRRKQFEKITVSDICEEAMIPRATFYNYFEDKYDLLDYFCQVYTQRLELEMPNEEMPVAVYLEQALAKSLESMQQNVLVYKDIYTTNENGYFLLHIRNHVRKYLTGILNRFQNQTNIPVDLISEVLASTVVSLSTWWIYHSEEYTIHDLQGYLNELTKSIQFE